MEASLVDNLRNYQGAIFLAPEEADAVVGHVLHLAAQVMGARTNARIAGLDPIAVTPSRRQNGIRSPLMARGLEECGHKGYHVVVGLRLPACCPRLGSAVAAASAYTARSADWARPSGQLSTLLVGSGGGEVRSAPEFPETWHAGRHPAQEIGSRGQRPEDEPGR